MKQSKWAILLANSSARIAHKLDLMEKSGAALWADVGIKLAFKRILSDFYRHRYQKPVSYALRCSSSRIINVVHVLVALNCHCMMLLYKTRCASYWARFFCLLFSAAFVRLMPLFMVATQFAMASSPCSLLFIRMNMDNDRTRRPNLWPAIGQNRWFVVSRKIPPQTEKEMFFTELICVVA